MRMRVNKLHKQAEFDAKQCFFLIPAY